MGQCSRRVGWEGGAREKMSNRFEFARRREPPPPQSPWGPRLSARYRLWVILGLTGAIALVAALYALSYYLQPKDAGNRSPASVGLPVYPEAYNFRSIYRRGGITGTFKEGSPSETRFLYDVPNGEAEDILDYYERTLQTKGYSPIGSRVHVKSEQNSHIQHFQRNPASSILEVRVFYPEQSPRVAKVLLSYSRRFPL